VEKLKIIYKNNYFYYLKIWLF